MTRIPENNRIIVALDFPAEEPALELVRQLDPSLCRLKVGKELFTRLGPQFVRRVRDMGHEVFLDLKFHDIPNTVAAACRAAADLGVWMVNVHASGGRAMLLAARDELERHETRPLLVAVTVLTSLGADDLAMIGWEPDPERQVLRLAALAQETGLDGVVCSPREVGALRQTQGTGFLLVTPGIRPATSEAGDQKRIMTPGQAIAAGASYLVIGRPITAAHRPLEALESISAEVSKELDKLSSAV